MLDGDGIGYQPWNSQKTVDKVHVVQYIPATMSASKMYRPLLPITLKRITTPLTFMSLPSSTWMQHCGAPVGWSHLKLKRTSEKYPLSTLVLDKTGSGIGTWSPRQERQWFIYRRRNRHRAFCHSSQNGRYRATRCGRSVFHSGRTVTSALHR